MCSNAIEKINRYTQGVTFEDFCAGEMRVDAVIRNFEIIGEAGRYVPQEVQDRYPDIAWFEMRSMRNFMIHQYSQANLKIIWDTIHFDLPPLVTKLQKILTDE